MAILRADLGGLLLGSSPVLSVLSTEASTATSLLEAGRGLWGASPPDSSAHRLLLCRLHGNLFGPAHGVGFDDGFSFPPVFSPPDVRASLSVDGGVSSLRASKRSRPALLCSDENSNTPYRIVHQDLDAAWQSMQAQLKIVRCEEADIPDRLEALLAYARLAEGFPQDDERTAEAAYHLVRNLRLSWKWRGTHEKNAAFRNQWFLESGISGHLLKILALTPRNSIWLPRLAGELRRYGLPVEENEIEFLRTLLPEFYGSHPGLHTHGSRMQLIWLTQNPSHLEPRDAWLYGLQQFAFSHIVPCSWMPYLVLLVVLLEGNKKPVSPAAILMMIAFAAIQEGMNVYFAVRSREHLREPRRLGPPAADADYEALRKELSECRVRMEEETLSLHQRLEAMGDYLRLLETLPKGHPRLEEAAVRVLKTIKKMRWQVSPHVRKILRRHWEFGSKDGEPLEEIFGRILRKIPPHPDGRDPLYGLLQEGATFPTPPLRHPLAESYERLRTLSLKRSSEDEAASKNRVRVDTSVKDGGPRKESQDDEDEELSGEEEEAVLAKRVIGEPGKKN